MFRRTIAGLATAAVALGGTVAAAGNGTGRGPTFELPEPTHDTEAVCDILIEMSDGVTLSADMIRAVPNDPTDDPGPYPTIVTVTGYNKRPGGYETCSPGGGLASGTQFFAERGYNVMIVDDRGTGSSEGQWTSWGERTQTDYEELLDWIATTGPAEGWGDGTAGMIGTSYMGITSFFMAEADQRRVDAGKDRVIQAIWADVPMADAYRDVTFHGGNMNTSFIPLWLGLVTALGAPPSTDVFSNPVRAAGVAADHVQGDASFQASVIGSFATGGENAYDGPFYRQRSPEEAAGTLEIPVAYTGGWFDIFQRGETRLFNALENVAPSQKKWFMFPIYHGAVPDDVFEQAGYGPQNAVKFAWFERWLKGTGTGVEAIPPITFQTMGTDTFTTPPSWPLPNTDWTRLYFTPESTGTATSVFDGTLAEEGPESAGEAYLPVAPLSGLCARSSAQWSAGFAGTGTECETDNRSTEATSVTFTSAPLETDTEVTGPITATFDATLYAADVTFAVFVSEVDDSGQSTQITSGYLNASLNDIDEARTRYTKVDGEDTIVEVFHPFTADSRETYTPGDSDTFVVEVFGTSHVFTAGNRIRVTIAATDLPHLPPADTLAMSSAGATAIHLDGSSSVLLPIVR